MIAANPANPREFYGMCCETSSAKVLWALGPETGTFSWLDSLPGSAPATPLFTVPMTVLPTVIQVSDRSLWMIDRQGAPRGRIVRIDRDAPDRANWTTMAFELYVNTTDGAGATQGASDVDAGTAYRVVSSRIRVSLRDEDVPTGKAQVCLADHRLFVGVHAPPRLAVFDTNTGKVVAALPSPQDSDDLYFDAARKRIYVPGGEGYIQVYQMIDPDHFQIREKIPTAIGAKTAGYWGKQGKGFDRFYLAVPARGGQSAEVRIYTVQD